MARTGLFLSVVAWVVGQWWTVSVAEPMNSRTFMAGFGNTGFYAATTSGWPGGQFVVGRYDAVLGSDRWLTDQWAERLHQLIATEHEHDLSAYTFSSSTLKRERQQEEIVRTPAFVVWSGRQPGIRVYHYLIVPTFTLINLALWWYYRKPKQVTTCES